MYLRHPSVELQKLFASRPFQGADPLHAVFLFVGLDANYDADIERTRFFARVREYHEDGPRFWRTYGVHHPFLLPDYQGDGRFYHRSFARIGFSPRHADDVSFVEAVGVPTAGRSDLEPHDLDPLHIAWLARVLLAPGPGCVFLSSKVLRLLRSQAPLSFLPSRPSGEAFGLPLLLNAREKYFFHHQHFSAYGKAARQKQLEAEAIRKLMLHADRYRNLVPSNM
ncbi:MAG TPA: hypothetical protein PKB14_14570 [Rubrivivax sp.]|nr:hypothetical protein [Rubrivivax sp.]